MSRPRTPTLNRAGIRSSALGTAQRRWLAGLACASWPAELGVRLSSLDSNIKSKEHLLHEISNQIMERRRDPGPP
jgi:hypothetical protein